MIGRPTSEFWLGGRELAGDYRVLEAGPRMRAVAEGFVLRLAAAAKRDDRASGEAELLPGLIEDLKVAVDANHPVVHYRNFCGHVVYFTSSPNVMLVSAVNFL